MLHHIIYRNTNSDVPWVVFIHGAGGSSTIWYKQINPFRKEYNLLLVDLRGHGRTLVEEHVNKKLEYTFPSIAQEIYEVLDANSIDKANFIGVSLGTILIRQLIEIDRNRVHSVVMTGAIVSLNWFSRFVIAFGNPIKKIAPYMLLYKLFAFIVLPRKSHVQSRAVFIHEAKKLKKKEFIRWFGLTRFLDETLKKFYVQLHHLPVLYISGKQDYMFIEDVCKMAELESKSKLAVVDNCGHIVNIERFEEFNAISLDWLRECNKKSLF
jgi:pimeloyl-ACP methyl ester carboxylesterase